MSVAIVTGSSGLVGSETARFFHGQGLRVIGIDNDSRRYFFGEEGSTAWCTADLKRTLKNFEHQNLDIRDQEKVFALFKKFAGQISLVVHAAAQPSHDWAAKEPLTDFTINAFGTQIMLEATRLFAPDAVFILTSTNKVYGDTPNLLPLTESKTRWEVKESHRYFERGIDETMSIDQTKHSLFGANKLSADVLAQEYGRYFGLKTGIFRGGCLTGPAHSGVALHGFLSYLVRCALTKTKYTIHGYQGKQVRDNIHSLDLVNAFWQFFKKPRAGEVYNLGGSRSNSCSILEAIHEIEKLSGSAVEYSITDSARAGDHIWWITDVSKFRSHYPEWKLAHSLTSILEEIIEATNNRTSESKAA